MFTIIYIVSTCLAVMLDKMPTKNSCMSQTYTVLGMKQNACISLQYSISSLFCQHLNN